MQMRARNAARCQPHTLRTLAMTAKPIRALAAAITAIAIALTAMPVIAQTPEDAEVQALSQSLRDIEGKLAQRRLEEAGKDTISLQLQAKIDIAKDKLAQAYKYLPWDFDLQRLYMKRHQDAVDALTIHQAKLRRERQMSLPTADIVSVRDSLRGRLAQAQAAANARAAQGRSTAAPAAPQTPASYPSDNILSGPDAIRWLEQHGYIDANGKPTHNFQDWQSRTHSSLSASDHALLGVGGVWHYGREGRIEGPVTIVVETHHPLVPSGQGNGGWNLNDGAVWSGTAGDQAPDSVNLLDRSTTDQPSNILPSRPPGYAPSHDEWLTMSEADQRYYFEPMRARERAQREAELDADRRELAAGAQRLEEGRIALEQSRAETARLTAEANRQEAATAALSSNWMMTETQRLMRQQAEMNAARYRGMQASGSVSGAVSSSGAPPSQAETPVSEPARNALLSLIDQRHQRWKATWCPRLISGCGIVPDGARDELKQWTRNATEQRQIDRIGRLLNCYDGCVMALPRNEQKAGQCRVQCKNTIQ